MVPNLVSEKPEVERITVLDGTNILFSRFKILNLFFEID